MSVWAVVVAAGRGDRLRGDRPKAFVGLRGRPLLAESLERLDGSEWIDGIVVAAPPGWEEPAILLAEELGTGKIATTVTGGVTRAESVRAGVAEVPPDALVILVHDAARPLLAPEVLERVLAALADADGAIPTIPLPDTVKRVSGGRIVETLDRRELVAAQTPQGFRADVLRRALAEGGPDATDCAALVESVGGQVVPVEGDPRLLKVTTPHDLALVETWLAR